MVGTEVAKLLVDHWLASEFAGGDSARKSLEMAGAMVTVMKLDGELQRFVDMSAESVGLRQLGVEP